MNFRLGELFCGPGGLGLAAQDLQITSSAGEKVGISHVWATDYHSDSCETYRENICPNDPDSVICQDVKTLNIKILDPIDAFAFGFPCNDFSIVGESKGLSGKFGPLYRYGVKVLLEFQPKWFVAENVGGLGNANSGDAFQAILRDLTKAGYVLTVHLFRFEKYGVPQTRHRIIIVGFHEDEGKSFLVPRPSDQMVSSREAIENPPILPGAPNNTLTRQSKRVVERLEYIRPGQNVWNADLPDHLKLRVKGARLSQIYKRLDPDMPAYTITGSGGGGTHGYHWEEPRALTNRERARLQTFPDSFVFQGSKESVRRQIGMAVPVKGAKVIFSAILKTFAGITYEHVSPSYGYVRADNNSETEVLISKSEFPKEAFAF
jgi:DNA (cytosine-5)-methyltransferase 1